MLGYLWRDMAVNLLKLMKLGKTNIVLQWFTRLFISLCSHGALNKLYTIVFLNPLA